MSAFRTYLQRHGKWLLLAASTLLGVALCETAARVLGLAPAVHAIWVQGDDNIYTRSTNGIMSYEIRPNFRYQHPSGVATSNSHGLRDRERSHHKPSGTRRILLLGDSVVEGIGFVGDQDTLSHKLETLYPDGKTEVLNFGTSGYCTRAEVELLADKGLAFEPDLVVLLFVINDYNNYTPELTMEGGVVDRPDWSKHLFLKSHLFRHFSLRWNWFDFGAELDPITWNRDATGNNNVVDGFARLRELANQHRFKLLVVPWPVFHDHDITYPQRIDGSRLLVERLASAAGLPSQRMDQRLRAAWQSRFASLNPRTAWTVNGDGMHPNGAGATIAAEILRDLIETPIPSPPYQAGPADPEAEARAASLSGAPSIPGKTPEQRRFRLLITHDRYDEAETYLRRLIAEDPKHPWAHDFLGRQLAQHGRRFDDALPHLQTALALNPHEAAPRILLAQVLSSRGKADEAIKLLQQGISLKPYDASFHFALGSICITNNQLKLARKHLNTTLELAPQLQEIQPLLEQLRKKEGPTP